MEDLTTHMAAMTTNSNIETTIATATDITMTTQTGVTMTTASTNVNKNMTAVELDGSEITECKNIEEENDVFSGHLVKRIRKNSESIVTRMRQNSECISTRIRRHSGDIIPRTRTTSETIAMESENSQVVAVIAIDSSIQSQDAVKFYFDHVHKKGNVVVLAHVIELRGANEAFAVGESYLTTTAWVNVNNAKTVKSRVLDEKYIKIIRDRGIKAVKVHTQGGIKAGETILKIAHKEQASMIITGYHGKGAIMRTLTGSVAHYVMDHASVPVIVCQHKAEDKNGQDN